MQARCVCVWACSVQDLWHCTGYVKRWAGYGTVRPVPGRRLWMRTGWLKLSFFEGVIGAMPMGLRSLSGLLVFSVVFGLPVGFLLAEMLEAYVGLGVVAGGVVGLSGGLLLGGWLALSVGAWARRVGVVLALVVLASVSSSAVAVAMMAGVPEGVRSSKRIVCLVDEMGQGAGCGFPGPIVTKHPAKVTCQSCSLTDLQVIEPWISCNDPRVPASEPSISYGPGLVAELRGRGFDRLKPADCVNCPRTESDRGYLLCVSRYGQGHQVYGRLPGEEGWSYLGGHAQLDKARALASSVLQWQDREDGERIWLDTLTFTDRVRADGTWGPPSVQYGRKKVEEFIERLRGRMSSWLITEEYGALGHRLHYHCVICADRSIGTAELRAAWPGGATVIPATADRPRMVIPSSQPRVVDIVEAAVVYVLKYCFKDYESGRPFYAGKQDGQSSFAAPERFRPRGHRLNGSKLTWVTEHNQGERFDYGKPPDPTRVGATRSLKISRRDKALAKRLVRAGFHEGMDRRVLMAAYADVKVRPEEPGLLF